MKWNAPYAAMLHRKERQFNFTSASARRESAFHFLWDVFSQMFCGNTLRFDSAYQRFGALPCSRCQTASGRQYFTAVCILYILYLCLCCMIKGRKTA